MKRFEFIKTICIVLLLLSAGFLTTVIGYYGGLGIFPSLPGSTPMGDVPISTQRVLKDGSQPLVISLQNDLGRTTLQQDFDRLDSGYESLGGFLAQALDTASYPLVISNDDFYQIVTQENGVYFRFPSAVDLPILALWLDGQTQISGSAQGFFLQVSPGSVTLLTEGDVCMTMSTQVDDETFLLALSTFSPDGSQFTQLDWLYPLTIFDPSPNQIIGGTAENPCDNNFLTQLASHLQFNPYGESKYTDNQGATVLTESDCTLRLDTEGWLTLKNPRLDDRYTAQTSTQADRIDYVSTLLEIMFAPVGGDGRLMFTGYQDDTVYFDYFLQGLPVSTSNEHSISATFDGKTLKELTVWVRKYTLDDTVIHTYLPATQAATLVPSGGTLALGYGDLNQSDLTVGWRNLTP